VALHEGLGGFSLLKKRKSDRQQEVIKKAGSDQWPCLFCSFLTEQCLASDEVQFGKA